MGEAWVGNNYHISSDGKAWISLDGMRKYRPPSYKPRIGKTQANFEKKFDGQISKDWLSNGHLDILD